MELEIYIKELEIEINLNDTTETRQRLAILRAHNELSSNKALNSILKPKQTSYDQGEKTGKLQAWRLKSMQNERSILEIKSEEGTTITNPQEINSSFQTFYSKLYMSESPQLIIFTAS